MLRPKGPCAQGGSKKIHHKKYEQHLQFFPLAECSQPTTKYFLVIIYIFSYVCGGIHCSTGDIAQRLCTAAEIKIYFNSFFEGSQSANYLKPNKNCNLTSWVSGCEPGWACSVGPDQQVDPNNAKVIPARTLDCHACCEGFFCPHGITCMIRKYLRILYMISFFKNDGSF